MLKMTELAQRPAVAYHPLEFRHGPISMVGPGTLVVFLYLPFAQALAFHRAVGVGLELLTPRAGS